MTELRRRMIEDMKLRGHSQHTQRDYLSCVRVLAKYYKRPPDRLSEQDIRNFFLYLIEERRLWRSEIENSYRRQAYARLIGGRHNPGFLPCRFYLGIGCKTRPILLLP